MALTSTHAKVRGGGGSILSSNNTKYTLKEFNFDVESKEKFPNDLAGFHSQTSIVHYFRLEPMPLSRRALSKYGSKDAMQINDY